MPAETVIDRGTCSKMAAVLEGGCWN